MQTSAHQATKQYARLFHRNKEYLGVDGASVEVIYGKVTIDDVSKYVRAKVRNDDALDVT
jgi:hypothetical protein